MKPPNWNPTRGEMATLCEWIEAALLDIQVQIDYVNQQLRVMKMWVHGGPLKDLPPAQPGPPSTSEQVGRT